MGVDESLRERLVSAGVDLLEQVGAGQLGLRAIAREAGVSHGAPRRYFPTHSALLAAIAAHGFADLAVRLGRDTGGEPRDRIVALALDYVRFAAERPEMFTLMFRHDLLEGSGENLRARTLPMYRDWARLVAATGEDDADDRALNLWTNLHGIATLVANRSIRLIAPDADIDALVRGAVARHLPTRP